MNIIDHYSKKIRLIFLTKKQQKIFYMVLMSSLVCIGNHQTYNAITVKNLKINYLRIIVKIIILI